MAVGFGRRFKAALFRSWDVIKSPGGIRGGFLLAFASALAVFLFFADKSEGAEEQLIRSLFVVGGGYLVYVVLVFVWQYWRLPHHMAWKSMWPDRVRTSTISGWSMEIAPEASGNVELTVTSPAEGDRPDLICFVLDKRSARHERIVPRVAEAGWGNPVLPTAGLLPTRFPFGRI